MGVTASLAAPWELWAELLEMSPSLASIEQTGAIATIAKAS